LRRAEGGAKIFGVFRVEVHLGGFKNTQEVFATKINIFYGFFPPYYIADVAVIDYDTERELFLFPDVNRFVYLQIKQPRRIEI
jgi:hypothetical protein